MRHLPEARLASTPLTAFPALLRPGRYGVSRWHVGVCYAQAADVGAPVGCATTRAVPGPPTRHRSRRARPAREDDAPVAVSRLRGDLGVATRQAAPRALTRGGAGRSRKRRRRARSSWFLPALKPAGPRPGPAPVRPAPVRPAPVRRERVRRERVRRARRSGGPSTPDSPMTTSTPPRDQHSGANDAASRRPDAGRPRATGLGASAARCASCRVVVQPCVVRRGCAAPREPLRVAVHLLDRLGQLVVVQLAT